jgi:hypothetical protein
MAEPAAPPGPIYHVADGRRALDWVRDNGWTGGLYVLVSTRLYTGRVDPAWVWVDRVSQGDASVYPIKGRCPDFAGRPGLGAPGQWKYDEVLAVAACDAPELRRLNPEFPWPSDG